MRTLLELAADLADHKITSEQLVADALARAEDSKGEGARAFLKVYRSAAMVAARASDDLRSVGHVPSPLAGIPVSIKDLFDVAGEPTTAAAKVLVNPAPARKDAEVVRRLRSAGAIIVGRTNMPQFAYSGVGQNPLHGTPRNPYGRDPNDVTKGRAPGGSSSGAAISVTDEMAAVAIGSDTGGSVRVPAALCGLVGFKPTQRRVPLTNVFPLSASLDSIGPLGRNVADCALTDAVLAGDAPVLPQAAPITRLRFAVSKPLLQEDLDNSVAQAFSQALSRLAKAGARIEEIALPEIANWPQILASGGILAAEAYALHREWLKTRASEYDHRVRMRLEHGAKLSAADYVDLVNARRAMQAAMQRSLENFDALLAPTTATVAPRLEELMVSDEHFFRANRLLVRNTGLINFLDGCALTVPCQEPGSLPVGLMISGLADSDHHILSVGRAIEAALEA